MTKEDVFFEHCPDSVILSLTDHNIKNMTPVAGSAFRELLSETGVHDYETQQFGRKQHGKVVDLPFLSTSDDHPSPGWNETTLNLYRAKGTRGERRFSISRMKRLISPGDVVVVGVTPTGGCIGANLSRVDDLEVLDHMLTKKLGAGSRPAGFSIGRETGKVERATSTVQRIVRDSSVSRRVKRAYEHACQICGVRIEGANGRPYAEGAHIRPLAEGGPDIKANMLCLCPSHHVELDLGALWISEGFEVQSAAGTLPSGRLKVAPDHELDPSFFEWHREHFEVGDG